MESLPHTYQPLSQQVCDLTLNQEFSQWYALFLLVFSSLVLIVSIIKIILHLRNGEPGSAITSNSKNSDDYHILAYS